MEPTDHNRRAFDDAHRTSENVLASPGMPDAIRERLHGASGTPRAASALRHRPRVGRPRRPGRARHGSGRRPGRRSRPRVAAGPTSRGCTRTSTRSRRSSCSGAGISSTSATARWRASARWTPWAHGVAAALRPGGVLLLHDTHPAGACLDAFGRWRADYFAAAGIGDLVTARGRRRAPAARARGVAREGPARAGPPRPGGRKRLRNSRLRAETWPWESQSASC